MDALAQCTLFHITRNVPWAMHEVAWTKQGGWEKCCAPLWGAVFLTSCGVDGEWDDKIGLIWIWREDDPKMLSPSSKDVMKATRIPERAPRTETMLALHRYWTRRFRSLLFEVAKKVTINRFFMLTTKSWHQQRRNFTSETSTFTSVKSSLEQQNCPQWNWGKCFT